MKSLQSLIRASGPVFQRKGQGNCLHRSALKEIGDLLMLWVNHDEEEKVDFAVA